MSGLGLPMADRPEEIGLSAERLERIRATLRHDVERRLIPGAVMLIARGGRIGFAEAFGWRDRGGAAPVTEEGSLEISAPVAEYLPEFKERTVGVEPVRARRTMTVHDLLRHTSGLTY